MTGQIMCSLQIWRGYRSIRLNKAYRAIYRIAADEGLELVYVEKVTNHEY